MSTSGTNITLTKSLASTFYIIFLFLSLLSVHISAHSTITTSSSGHKSNNKSCNNNNNKNKFGTKAAPPCQKPPPTIEPSPPTTSPQKPPLKTIEESSSPPPTISPQQPPLVFADQRLELVYPVIQKFKSTITSDPLGVTKTWIGSDICSYKGFFCDTPPYNNSAIALASIDFNGFQLAAPTLDGFIDNLPDIALFHANSNGFGGTITPKISKLPYLYEIDLSNNQLSGPFPVAVLGMETLTFLDIRFNLFTGSVPPQIFDQNLEVLFINNNVFTQGLPENLERTHILLLTLANNNFMGPIPRSLPKALSTLTEVLLMNNELTGCLPYEIGYLEQARVFDAGENQLTGPLPLSLSCLQNLEILNLAGNLLYGIVPEIVCASLGNNGGLVNFSISDNYFTHVGPFCRVLIQKGVLDVSNNCIPDLPFQRSVVDCAEFFAQPRVCPFMWYRSFIPCKLPFP